MTADQPDPEDTDHYWTVKLHTTSPSQHECGAREHTAELVLQHDDRGRQRSAGRAHLVVVPFGESAAEFLDRADEVSAASMAAAEFAIPDFEILDAPGMVFVSSVELDEDVRGSDLGKFLLINAVRALTDLAPDALVVLEPAPINADSLPEPARRDAIDKLVPYWASAGFEFDEFTHNPRFMSVRARGLVQMDPYPRVQLNIAT